MSSSSPGLRQDSAPSYFGLVLDFLKARLLSIAFLIGVGIAVAAYLEYDVVIPRRAKLAILGIVAITPYGYLVGQYVKSLVYDPMWVYLVDVAAEDPHSGHLYRFSSYDFSKLEVTTGELDNPVPHLYFGRNADLEAMTVEGNWRGTLSDRELLEALHQVYECRNQLEADAKRGFAIQSSAWTIVRQATRSAVDRVVDVFEEGTLPDEGEGIEAAVDAAVEEFDLPTVGEESVEDPVVDEAELEESLEAVDGDEPREDGEVPEPTEMGAEQ